MAHGLNTVLKRGTNAIGCKSEGKTGIGSRRIFAPQFKLQVLDSYRNDADCKGNQRATARKYGIHRRQIQKWLQVENNLRSSVSKSKSGELIASPEARKCGLELALRSAERRQRDDEVLSRPFDTEAEPADEPTPPIGRDQRVPDIPPQHAAICDRDSQLSPHSSASSSSSASSAAFPCADCPEPALPLDFTTHTRTTWSPDCAPIDLSLKKSHAVPCFSPDHHPPVPRATFPFSSPDPPPFTAVVTPSSVYDSQIWDLSTKRFKREDVTARASPSNPSPLSASPPAPQPSPTGKPVKLFKPYLDHVINDHCMSEDDRPEDDRPDDDRPAIIVATIETHLSYPRNEPYYPHHPHNIPNHHNNNNINTFDLKHHPNYSSFYNRDDASSPSSSPVSSTISSSVPPPASHNTHPPATHLNSNFDLKHNQDYPSLYNRDDAYSPSPSAPVSSTISSSPSLTIPAAVPSSAAVSLYAANSVDYYTGIHFPNGGIQYDDINGSFSSFGKSLSVHSVKQRQSYSLDFKLSAIECYYSDAVCRGNQRAVASKFKIHRRQVQKWLKQENQLRQRNETVKPIIPMHIVR